MVIGNMSIPDEFGQWDWKRFKFWYEKAMVGNPETAEEVFLKLGGKLPTIKAKKVESSEE
jgi:hypothetical protein